MERPKYNYRSNMSLEERLMMAVIRASEFMKKEASSVIRNYGLTFAQYNALRVLDASENGQNTMTNVSRIMLVSGGNITGITKRLENRGFLIKKRDPKDDRINILEITPKGRSALSNISSEKDEKIRMFFSEYSEDEKSYLLLMIKKIIKLSSQYVELKETYEKHNK